MLLEEDRALLRQAVTGRVHLDGDLEDLVGEVGRAVLDVVEQPPDQPVLEGLFVHVATP